MAEREAQRDAPEKAPEKKKSSMIMWIVVFVVVALVATGGFLGLKFYEKFASEKKKDEPKASAPLIGPVWSMGAVIVNLMDNEGTRYLKTSIKVELSSPESSAELEGLKPKIMDSVLDLLSSKSYKDIAGFEGKQRLRDEIMVRLNNYMSQGVVKRVYFTEFVIQ
ncbi:MAG: flagellar basal body-associated FliL family protein [Deltaproteobacteria bacterium]|nr:flagellar basal body-associated FliL family protein [Deltaproteobacteria bacterium]